MSWPRGREKRISFFDVGFTQVAPQPRFTRKVRKAFFTQVGPQPLSREKNFLGFFFTQVGPPAAFTRKKNGVFLKEILINPYEKLVKPY